MLSFTCYSSWRRWSQRIIITRPRRGVATTFGAGGWWSVGLSVGRSVGRSPARRATRAINTADRDWPPRSPPRPDAGRQLQHPRATQTARPHHRRDRRHQCRRHHSGPGGFLLVSAPRLTTDRGRARIAHSKTRDDRAAFTLRVQYIIRGVCFRTRNRIAAVRLISRAGRFQSRIVRIYFYTEETSWIPLCFTDALYSYRRCSSYYCYCRRTRNARVPGFAGLSPYRPGFARTRKEPVKTVRVIASKYSYRWVS